MHFDRLRALKLVSGEGCRNGLEGAEALSLLGAWAAREEVQSVVQPLPAGPFDLLMIDPPWTFVTRSEKGVTVKGAGGQYDLMTLKDIKALPVAAMAAPDCMLILWATNPLLDKAFEVMSAWGFTFKTAAHWVKRTTNGHLAFGTGYVLRGAGEPLLLGVRGKPKTARSCRSVFEGPVRGHSRKPDEAFAWAEALMPDARRCELFSRQSRNQWTTWGNESKKFDVA